MTLGKRGAILLEISKDDCAAADVPEAQLDSTISSLFAQLNSTPAEHAGESENGGARCVSASGVAVVPGKVTSTSGVVRLKFNRAASQAEAALRAALAASSDAAALNAEEGSGERYAYGKGMPDPEEHASSSQMSLCAKVRQAPSSRASSPGSLHREICVQVYCTYSRHMHAWLFQTTQQNADPAVRKPCAVFPPASTMQTRVYRYLHKATA